MSLCDSVHGLQEGTADADDRGEDGSDAESDGYGEAGLSWEAVMQSIQVPPESAACVAAGLPVPA